MAGAPTIRDGRDEPLAISPIGIADVFVAMIACGLSIASILCVRCATLPSPLPPPSTPRSGG